MNWKRTNVRRLPEVIPSNRDYAALQRLAHDAISAANMQRRTEARRQIEQAVNVLCRIYSCEKGKLVHAMLTYRLERYVVLMNRNEESGQGERRFWDSFSILVG